MKVYKRIIMICLCISMVISATGCSAMPVAASVGIADAFSDRINQNLKIAEALYKAGLVNETLLENVTNNIANVQTNIIDNLKSENPSDAEKAANALIRSISWYSVDKDVANGTLRGSASNTTRVEEILGDSYDGEKDSDYFFLNWVDSLGSVTSSMLDNINVNNVIPIEIISDENTQALQDVLGYPIYIINENITDMSKLKANLNTCIDSNTLKISSYETFDRISDQYFNVL